MGRTNRIEYDGKMGRCQERDPRKRGTPNANAARVLPAKAATTVMHPRERDRPSTFAAPGRSRGMFFVRDFPIIRFIHIVITLPYGIYSGNWHTHGGEMP
jgi:hypothetical protein